MFKKNCIIFCLIYVLLQMFSVTVWAGGNGVGSASVSNGSNDGGDWELKSGGSISTPVYLMNRTYSGQVDVDFSANVNVDDIASGEIASVTLTPKVFSDYYSDVVTKDYFTITFYARANKYHSDTHVYGATYTFKKNGVVVATVKRNFGDVRLESEDWHTPETVTFTQGFNISSLGLSAGTYTVDLFVDADNNDKSSSFGSITIASPGITEYNKPSITYDYDVTPVTGFEIVKNGYDLFIKRMTNYESSDLFTATLKVNNATDSKVYEKSVDFEINSARLNQYAFIIDKEMISSEVPENLIIQKVKTGSVVTVPTFETISGYKFVGFNPSITGELISDGTDHVYRAVFEVDKDQERPSVSDVTYDGYAIVGETLTARYSYNSNIKEEGTSYRWIAKPADGSSEGVYILGENSESITITSALAGKMIDVEVTPSNTNGFGEAVFSGKSDIVRLKGDIDFDNDVDFIDGSLLYAKIKNNEITNLNENLFLIFDANNDNQIDLMDLKQILRIDVLLD